MPMEPSIKLEYEVGDTRYQGKELTTTREGKVLLLNNLDYSEFLGKCILELNSHIIELSETISQLQADMRKLRVGQEAYVYGETVEESDEVDQDELVMEEVEA